MDIKTSLKNGVNFIKKNPEILWSLLLIVVVPLTLFLNTNMAVKSFDSVIGSFKKEVEYNLSSGDLVTERVIELFTADLIQNPELLQKKVEEIVKKSDLKITDANGFEPMIAKLKIETYESNGFKTIAAYPQEETEEENNQSKENEIGRVAESYKLLAWNQLPDESIMFETINNEGTRFRNIVKTIYDSSGKKLGLITLTTSLKYADERLKEADAQTANSFNRLYIFLTVSILLCLFLIFNHTRLFQYSVLYNKIREVDKMKDDFISMTAHELRTPITAIRGYADILKSELGQTLNEVQSEHLERVILSTERLNDLINDILDVSRIEQGRISMELQEISPQKLIKEVVDELKVKADEKGLQLIFEQKEEPYLILADPQRLKQILINLIGNSIKYTKKGKVEIETKVDEFKGKSGKYSISVKDTGIGMSAEAQKGLFEKFYRVKTNETAEISGTGLGLWITKALTEKMGGEIFVESMEGVGSKFTVVFPLIKKRETSALKPKEKT